MTGKERRQQLIDILAASPQPVSGTELANRLSVSRQSIVQDIALIRANGTDILSTNTGYLLSQEPEVRRVVKVLHTEHEVEEELNLIVDLGGRIDDVFVYHKAYGVVRADMNIRYRKNIREFMEKLSTGKSSLLMNTTSGYHYHTISADNEETLNQIFEALKERDFLAPLQDYEPVKFW